MRISDWSSDVCSSDLAQGDSVRVLTVHGAKGLQAPLVILADATVDPKRMGNMLGFDWELEPGGSKLPVLPPRRAEKFGAIEEEARKCEQAEWEEHWRRSEERRVGQACVSTGRSRW